MSTSIKYLLKVRKELRQDLNRALKEFDQSEAVKCQRALNTLNSILRQKRRESNGK